MKKKAADFSKYAPLTEHILGKKVIIESPSLYDQISNDTVIVELIEGNVISVGDFGILLDNTVRKRYVNGKYQGDMQTPTKRCIVYHKMINHIFLKE